MKKFRSTKKIMWVVDPFQKDTSHLNGVATTVDAYAHSSGASVEVSYAYTLPQVPIQIKALSRLEKPFLLDVESKLVAIAGRLERSPHSVKIVTHHAKKNYTPATELLIDHAKKNKIDVIAVSSHGRGGLKRLFMGSFAEDLLLTSPLPVFIVGPHLKRDSGGEFKRILLPVDFTARCKKLFIWCQAYAKTQKARLTVFHGAVDYFAPLIQPAAMALGGSYPFDIDSFISVIANQKRQLDAWVASARKNRVDCDGIFHDRGGAVYETICNVAAKKGHELIIMGTHHGAVSAMVVGSVTRQVARHASVPVLAIKI